ncbi:MAG: FGGY family carbohydrate kinase [Acidilobaceae archaeon]
MYSKKDYILAIDVGTSRIKAGLVNVDNFKIEVEATREAPLIIQKPKWAEVDLRELWSIICDLASGIVNGRQVRALVFSGHLAGVVPVDSNCNPLRNLIIWLDERASGYPRELFSGLIRFKGYNLLRLLEFLLVTGGTPSKTGKDPISKILWIRDNEPDIWNKTFKFLGTNSFLLAKTTGNYVTSPDDASLTWLLDTRNFRNIWSLRLLRKYGIPIDKLPRIARSIDIAGRIKLEAANELNIDPNIPVIVGSGDLTSAA